MAPQQTSTPPRSRLDKVPLRASTDFTSLRLPTKKTSTPLSKRRKPIIQGAVNPRDDFASSQTLPDLSLPVPVKNFRYIVTSLVDDSQVCIYLDSTGLHFGNKRYRIPKNMMYRLNSSHSEYVYRFSPASKQFVEFKIWAEDNNAFKNTVINHKIHVERYKDSPAVRETHWDVAFYVIIGDLKYTYVRMEFGEKLTLMLDEPVHLTVSSLRKTVNWGGYMVYNCDQYVLGVNPNIHVVFQKLISNNHFDVNAFVTNLSSKITTRKRGTYKQKFDISPFADSNGTLLHSNDDNEDHALQSQPTVSESIGLDLAEIEPLSSLSTQRGAKTPHGTETHSAEIIGTNDTPRPMSTHDFNLCKEMMSIVLRTMFLNHIIKHTPKPKPKRSRVVESYDLVTGAVEPTTDDVKSLETEGFKPFKYTFHDQRSVTVQLEDIVRLNPSVYLNDNLIWFFMKKSLDNALQDEAQLTDDVLVLDTFFYSAVRQSVLPTWIKKSLILKRGIVFMPINEMQHWSLALIIGLNTYVHQCEQQGSSDFKPKILILDSLGTHRNFATARKVVTGIKNILEFFELPSLTLRDCEIIKTDIPQQQNSTDCGVYLLHYVDRIMNNLRLFVDSVNNLEGNMLTMGQFWRHENVHACRTSLKSTLKELGNNCEPPDTISDDEDSFLEILETSATPKKRRRITLKEYTAKDTLPDLNSSEIPPREEIKGESDHVKEVKETEPKEVETEPKEVETELKEVETEPKEVETEPKEVETEPKEVETEPKKVETDSTQKDSNQSEQVNLVDVSNLSMGHGPEPTTNQSVEPVIEVNKEPACESKEPSVESVPEPVIEVRKDPIHEPVTEPIVEVPTKPVPELIELPIEPVTAPVHERIVEVPVDSSPEPIEVPIASPEICKQSVSPESDKFSEPESLLEEPIIPNTLGATHNIMADDVPAYEILYSQELNRTNQQHPLSFNIDISD